MKLAQKNKIKTGGGLSAISAVILVILTFFMVMAVISKKEEAPVLPEAENTFHPDVTVVITEDNQYYLLPDETEKDKRGFDEIRDLIVSKMLESKVPQLKVEGHQLAKYETVYNVAGLAQKNHWQYRLDFTRMPAEE